MSAFAKLLSSTTLLVLLVALGCAKKKQAEADPLPPEVVVVKPVLDTRFVEREEFTGYTRAVETVEIRARVTGYLLGKEDEGGIAFKEGEDVPKGAPLFKIDPRTYLAEQKKAEASLESAEATFDRLSGDLRRANASGTAVSVEERARIAGNRKEAEAAIGVAKAMLEQAKLNVGFTVVKAPFAGRLSRQRIDPGNLVKADDTVLTTMVSLDPIHAYFDVDERTVLDLRKRIRDNEVTSARETKVKVDIGLANESGFSRAGEIDFVDNQLDPGTGTLSVRALVKNPAPTSGSAKKPGKTHMLSPGMFVRVRLPIGKERTELLVPEDALGSDQGERYVYVVREGKTKAGDAEKDGGKVYRLYVVVGQQVVYKDAEGREVSMRAVSEAKPRTAAKGKKEDDPPPKLGKDSLIVIKGQQRVKAGKVATYLKQESPSRTSAMEE